MWTPIARRFPAFRLLLLFAALVLIGACADGDDAADDGAAVEEAEQPQAAWLDELAAAYVRIYNAGHADSVASLYTEDAVLLAADGTVATDRGAIAAWNARQMAEGSPRLEVDIIDRKVFGDTALAIGSYAVSVTTAEGEEMQLGGHWMAAYGRTSDGWKSLGLITNYDRQVPAEQLQGAVSAEPPPDVSTRNELHAAYENAWNAGDTQAFTDLYAADAWAAFSNLPAIEGREAIVSAVQQRMAGTRLALQGTRTIDLGDGWRVDGGVHQTTREEGEDIRGHFWVLSHTGADGETRIQWVLSNARPLSATPSGDSP